MLFVLLVVTACGLLNCVLSHAFFLERACFLVLQVHGSMTWRVKPNDVALPVSACFFVVLASCNLVCSRNCCALMHFGK